MLSPENVYLCAKLGQYIINLMFTMRKKLLLVLAMLVPLIGFSVEKQKTASVRWGTFNIRLKNTGHQGEPYRCHRHAGSAASSA